MGFPGDLAVKNLPAKQEGTGEVGLIPGLGRSSVGGSGHPFQYSCLGNSMERGAWKATCTGSQRVGHDRA